MCKVVDVSTDGLPSLSPPGQNPTENNSVAFSKLISVFEIILRFRCELIEEKVSDLQNKTKQNKDEHHDNLLEEIIQYHKLKTVLSERLNKVI